MKECLRGRTPAAFRARSGFTLVELLVAVAVIALLVGIVLPALSRARQTARATVCLSRLYSLGQAMQMYVDANDGRFPTVGFAHGGLSDETTAWINVAAAEIGSAAVTRCPTDQSRHWTEPLPGTDRLRQLSYATNYYTTGSVVGREEYVVATRIPRPATTIFWVELAEDGNYAAADHVHPETWFANPRTLATREVQLERHSGRANYGLIDGHVEAMKFEATYQIDRANTQFPRIAWTRNKYDPAAGW